MIIPTLLVANILYWRLNKWNFGGLESQQDPNVQNDLLIGENGALKMNKEELMDLTELTKALKPSLREPDFASKIEAGAEVVAKLFGK